MTILAVSVVVIVYVLFLFFAIIRNEAIFANVVIILTVIEVVLLVGYSAYLG